MTHRLSPEELDLDRSEMSEEDWKARVEQLESAPELALEIIAKLTEAQKTVLEMAVDRGCRTHSGRGGWSVTTMRALERQGCVTKGRESMWETHWKLTTRGSSVGRMLRQQSKNALDAKEKK